MTNIDTSPEAVERMDKRLRGQDAIPNRNEVADYLLALFSALTQSRAETAAAYEQGMRDAAGIADAKYAAGEVGNPGHHILAAIPKGELK